MVRHFGIFALLLGVFLQAEFTTAAFDAQTQSVIDNVINTGIQYKKIPGISVAVIKDGQVLMDKGYGVKDYDTGSPVTSNTLFQIASTTKAFTAALLSNVVAADSSKKISTSVRRALTSESSFKFNNTLRTVYATLEDLLAHRTGIPKNNYLRLASDYDIHTYASKLRYLPNVGGFRDSFFYNNLMYGLAVYATEDLAGGVPWKTQIRDTIFTPLGMSRSTFVDEVDFVNDDVATPYNRESGQNLKVDIDFLRHWGKCMGSGNIFSTSSDMAKWLLMLLNDGKDTQGQRVLRSGVMDEVFKRTNIFPPYDYSPDWLKPVTPVSFSGDTYSLGWKQGFYNGYQLIYHSGSTFGYRAYITLLPAMNVGVVSLFTGADYDYKFRTALHMHLMDQAMGHTPWINSSTVCTFPDPWRSEAAAAAGGRKRRSVTAQELVLTEVEEGDEARLVEERRRIARASRVRRAASLPLSNYVGVFRHGAYGNLEVRLNATTQGLELEYGVGLWRLDSAGGNDFNGVWIKVPPTLDFDFTFLANGGGVYAVEAVGFEGNKPPIFYK